MEKKVTKKFYYVSALNLIPAIIMGQMVLIDTLVLIGIAIALVLNHTVLVKMVSQLSTSMSAEGNDAKQALKKTLFFMLSKMIMLGAIMGLLFFFNQNLIPKMAVLVIFQLIIQVVSIKNNY